MPRLIPLRRWIDGLRTAAHELYHSEIFPEWRLVLTIGLATFGLFSIAFVFIAATDAVRSIADRGRRVTFADDNLVSWLVTWAILNACIWLFMVLTNKNEIDVRDERRRIAAAEYAAEKAALEQAEAEWNRQAAPYYEARDKWLAAHNARQLLLVQRGKELPQVEQQILRMYADFAVSVDFSGTADPAALRVAFIRSFGMQRLPDAFGWLRQSRNPHVMQLIGDGSAWLTTLPWKPSIPAELPAPVWPPGLPPVNPQREKQKKLTSSYR